MCTTGTYNNIFCFCLHPDFPGSGSEILPAKDDHQSPDVFRLRSCDQSFSTACVAADCWLRFTGGGGVFLCSLCLLHLLLLSVSCRLAAAMVAATSLLQQNSSRVFVPQLQEF